MKSYRVKAYIQNAHGYIGVNVPESVQATKFSQAARQAIRLIEEQVRGRRVQSVQVTLDLLGRVA